MSGGFSVDFSGLERECSRLGVGLIVTRCEKPAVIPGLVFCPAGFTQAEVDALVAELPALRRSS